VGRGAITDVPTQGNTRTIQKELPEEDAKTSDINHEALEAAPLVLAVTD
jgi:hypothetical protein